jgi:hypothetical protein
MVPIVAKAITGRDEPGKWILLELLLLFNPMFWGAATFTFHIETMFAFIILVAIWALHRGKDWVLWACVIVLLGASERSAISVFGIGIYAFLMLGRRRLGVGLAVLSTVYFFTACYVIMPALSGIPYPYSGMINPFVDVGKKVLYVAAVYGFFFFTPLMSRRGITSSFAALPCVGANIASARIHQYWLIGFQYNDQAVMFMLVAAIYGLADKKVGRGVLCWSGLVCAAFFSGRIVREMKPLSYAPAPAELRAFLAPYKAVGEDVTIITNDKLAIFFSGNRKLNYVDNVNIDVARSRTVLAFGKHFEDESPDSVRDDAPRPQSWDKVLPRLRANPHLHLVCENEYGAVWASEDLLNSFSCPASPGG